MNLWLILIACAGILCAEFRLITTAILNKNSEARFLASKWQYWAFFLLIFVPFGAAFSSLLVQNLPGNIFPLTLHPPTAFMSLKSMAGGLAFSFVVRRIDRKGLEGIGVENTAGQPQAITWKDYLRWSFFRD